MAAEFARSVPPVDSNQKWLLQEGECAEGI